MAVRYSGQLRIDCLFNDRSDQYRCVISRAGKRLSVQYVQAPRHMTVAVDNPKAYDGAAVAALSFAYNDKTAEVERYAGHTRDGWEILRSSRRPAPASAHRTSRASRSSKRSSKPAGHTRGCRCVVCHRR